MPPGVAPTITVGGSAANLANDVQGLAPLANTWSGPAQGVPVQQNIRQAYTPQPGVLAKFTGFLGNVASQTGHIIGGVTNWLATNAVQMAEAPFQAGVHLEKGAQINGALNAINTQNQQISDQIQTIHNQYKQGIISATQYRIGLDNISKNSSSLAKQSTYLSNQANIEQKATYQATINTASTLVTLLTAGFGKAVTSSIKFSGGLGLENLSQQSAADYLASAAAKPFLDPVVSAIQKVVGQPGVFQKLDWATQQALQRSTAEVIAQAGSRITASQIAKATAANVALKYPIYFNMVSSQGLQIYKQLDQGKFGDAVRTLAFNALLLLSGGPIGHAMGIAGGALGKVADVTFGKTTFWDQLSKFYGDGSPDGFKNAIQDMANGLKGTEREQFIKNVSAVEATNVAAVGGDAGAAAARVANGMRYSYGFSLDQVPHNAGLQDMVKWAKNARLAQDVADKNGLGNVVVGRLDARDLNVLSSRLSPITDPQARLQTWDTIKSQNPNQSFANSSSFDSQIKSILSESKTPAEIDQAIRGIDAQTTVAGFPSSVSKQMAKDGYIAIQPKNIEAPFKEGKGTVATKFSPTNDFFTHATQPLPVLGTIGATLTKLGMSPVASADKVYQVFNDNLANAIQKSDLLPVFSRAGDTPQQTADSIIKKISDYAKEPTRGGVSIGHGANARPIRPPITDLRQLTTNDLKAALPGTTDRQISDLKGAILQAHLDIAASVSSAGDKLMDWNYKLNPLAAPYARIQGATRFAWNPVFAAKLNYKTEFLAQAEAGGKFPTLLGTNFILKHIFPDKYNQLNDVRELLRGVGMFDKPAGIGNVVSGEGVNEAGAGSANLTHALLPGQERSIAGLVSVQADKAGLPVDQFINQHPNEVRDTIQSIAQYDRRSSFLNSPLARTLNFAFFPFRFETKVAMIMADSLAKQPALIQLAVIKGLYNGSNFLKSTQGQVWYSQNTELIGLMKYFSPVTTLSSIAQALGQPPHSVGQYGELGGLPFGFIPQLLDSMGWTHIGTTTAMVGKDGTVIPNYIPTTAKGDAMVGIQDLLTALFTYPGATAGLPSKASISRNIAKGVTGGNIKTDFRTVTPQITDQQKQYQQAIQSATGNAPQPTPQAQHYTPGTPMPTSPSSLLTPPKGRVKSAKSAKLKKSQMAPALLPGQTGYGQL